MSFRYLSLAFSLFAAGSIPATVSAQAVGETPSAQFELKGVMSMSRGLTCASWLRRTADGPGCARA